MNRPTITIGELFTEDQLAQAREIVLASFRKTPHKDLLGMVTPLMPHINEVTGQENSADYFAYLLESIVMENVA